MSEEIAEIRHKISDKLENLPAEPGIYQFFNENGKVIYIGKAKNLRNRVRSYFHTGINSPKTLAMVSKVADLQMIITDTEVEALVLENNLIKDLKPRYNINLKDDKTFPYIRVTNEPFPQIFTTRTLVRDGSKYFGPYTDVKSMKASLKMLNKIFKIRSCKYLINDETIEKRKIKVCLDYHIKKCGGPCEGLVNKTEYSEMVGEVVKVLRGKTDDLIRDLTLKMNTESADLKFENAAELRDKIDQLRVYNSKQKIVSENRDDRDVISFAAEGKDVASTILNIRNGRLTGKKQFRLGIETGEFGSDILAAIIRFYYGEFVEIPKEILCEEVPADKDILLDWLRIKGGHKIDFVIPKKKSEARSLLEMCSQNANLLLKEIQLQRMKKEGNVPHVLVSLKRDLRLKNIPRRIECFDISNLQGTDTVASMVVFEDAKPKKSLYRKFIIRTVEGPNDFASMMEVITRRYTRVIDEKITIPDLIMVDGGKGQLSSAVKVLNNLGMKHFEIIGLAKRLEEVYLPGTSEPVIIPRTSSALKLLQHLRDEAHRFAITFHRSRRDKRTFTTELTSIKGIGEAIATRLLTSFSSIDEIRKAAFSDLAILIGNSKAKLIVEHYSRELQSDETEP